MLSSSTDTPASQESRNDIPIENIYYLLLYAWDCLEELDPAIAGAVPESSLTNLLAKVMSSATSNLLRRGLKRSYAEVVADVAGVRGKVLFADSVKRNLFASGTASCSFDEMSFDGIENRIVYETLKMLAVNSETDPVISKLVSRLLKNFPKLSPLRLSQDAFKLANASRPRSPYKYLLKLSEFAFSCLVPTPSGEHFQFQKFLQDERRMRVLFERFVRNFYKRELYPIKVKVSNFNWNFVGASAGCIGLLPRMVTDVTIRAPNKTFVIDTKYTPAALAKRNYSYNEKMRSAHLYQMHSYLMNMPQRYKRPLCGIILYPEVNFHLDEEFTLPGGDELHVKTLNLNQPWEAIAARLHSLLTKLPVSPSSR